MKSPIKKLLALTDQSSFCSLIYFAHKCFDTYVVGNRAIWGNQKEIKKIMQNNFYGKKTFKLTNKFQNFFRFQRLIHKINLIAIESLKNL